jgi:ribosomal protein S26
MILLARRKSAVKGMVVVVRALRCGEVVPQGRRAFRATSMSVIAAFSVSPIPEQRVAFSP